MGLLNNKLKSKMPYAFSRTLNRQVGVDEVERGLDCNCTCIGCGMDLVSKQGENNIHHFAHYKDANESFDYSYWVSIRDLAKQIFRELKYIQCDNIPEAQNSSVLNDKAYKVELQGEEIIHEKQGMDIFFSSNIGLIGIYFLTDESDRVNSKYPNNDST